MDERFSFLTDKLSEDEETSRPIRRTFWHASSGCEGEVGLHYWPPARGNKLPPEHVIVFILGNPGLLDYYIPFLAHLHYLLPIGTSIVSLSHIGHSPDLPAPENPFDLYQHLENKVEFVSCLRGFLDDWAFQDRRRGGERSRLSLMGHSVGSWILVSVMKRLPKIVDSGYMLFPTLGWIADTWNGRTLWPIFHRPIRSIIPYLSTLLTPILPFTSFPKTTLSLLRSPRTITHALSMASSEMKLIKEPDLNFIHSLSSEKLMEGVGLYGIWAGGDGDSWVGREGEMVRDVMGGEYGGRVSVLNGVPHAFCLTRHHSQQVADIVAGWIDPSGDQDDNHSMSDASAILTSIPM